MAPVLQNQDPSPGQIDVPIDSSVALEIVDTGTGLNESTVVIKISGADAWKNDAQQPGFSVAKTAVTDGFRYVINPTSTFSSFQSVLVEVYAVDNGGSGVLDTSYSFTTWIDPSETVSYAFTTSVDENDAVVYQFTTSAGLALVSVVAITQNIIRVTYSNAMKRVDSSAENDASNPYNYIIEGGYRPLDASQVMVRSSNVFDLVVPEMTDGDTYTLTVRSTVENVDDVAIGSGEEAQKTFLGKGIAPILLSVTNPAAGILNLDFSEALENDMALQALSTYEVTPLGTAADLIITQVTTSDTLPSRVVLTFSGGGSVYRMTVRGVLDVAGNIIQSPHNTTLFKIGLPSVDELQTGERIYFETNLGAIRLGISQLSKRRIEDLAILRAQNQGHKKQFENIVDALKSANIIADDSMIKLFKG